MAGSHINTFTPGSGGGYNKAPAGKLFTKSFTFIRTKYLSIMNAFTRSFIILSLAANLLFTSQEGLCQTYGSDDLSERPRSGFWPSGKKMALSLTFDDARLSQIDKGIPLLDKYGAKATFYISPGNMLKKAEEWKKAAINGHDIGNHSVLHPCSGNFEWSRGRALEDYTVGRMKSELDSANRLIEKIFGIRPASFAYPCGQTFVGRGAGAQSYVPVIASMFESGRGWLNEAPNDPYYCDLAQLNASELDGKSFAQVLQLIETAKANGHWLILAGHEMNDEGRQTSLLLTIEEICKYASDTANGIWIDNINNVASYVGQKRLEESVSTHRKGIITIKAKPGAKVTVEQIRHEFWFGCAISNGLGSGKMSENDLNQYKEKFLQNFNSAVTENAVKWGSMEPRQGEVDYTVIDGILKWTEENSIPLRGHNLFWGIPQFVQPWVRKLSDDELRHTLQNRAETVTNRYKGRFVEYDLNNEMIHGNYYEDRLGPEITKLMADWAHNGDPDAKLWLNDYDILTGNRLADYMAHIRKLLKQGVPVAGIGVQGHLHGETFDRAQLKMALDSLAVFKLPLRVTEFNMPGQRSKYYREKIQVMSPQEEELNAKELTDYYRMCFAHPAVDGILMWGFWAGANWIPVSSLYNRDWSPTPSAEAYQDLIFREWWTLGSGVAGEDGTFSLPAFYGKYKITVNRATKEVDLKKVEGKLIVDFTNKKK
jgi:GH35 family endo-1,4-beta-xylanase/peptidoglycan/xylan/chitin deacetylase (PgdA/CDA1 family)